MVGMVPGVCRLDRLIAQAGVAATLTEVLLGMALGVALAAALLRLALAPVPALALAAGLGIGFPLLALRRRRAARRRVLEAQLPDVLELLAAATRDGQPIGPALARIGAGTPDPLGAELEMTAEDVALGQPLDVALAGLGERAGLPDLGALTIAVALHERSGADLARMLETLARLARAGA
jgi:tight adherence protein B